MGMFDSVYLRCPHCGNELEFQSKVGKCVLANYSENDCPAEIGKDLAGEVQHCEGCHKTLQFSFQEIQKPVIIIKLIEAPDA